MRNLGFGLIVSSVLLGSGCVAALGQKEPLPTDKPVQMVTPVFHEQVLFALPPTFQVMARDQVSATGYLREMPLRGETVEKWTQMVSLTGAKDMAKNPRATPEAVAKVLAEHYKTACPTTFSVLEMATPKITGKASAIIIVGCGTLLDMNGKAGSEHAEQAMIIAIAGESDIYTIQWAERMPAQNAPLKIDNDHWLKRFAVMQPIKICPLAGGTAGCVAQ